MDPGKSRRIQVGSGFGAGWSREGGSLSCHSLLAEYTVDYLKYCFERLGDKISLQEKYNLLKEKSAILKKASNTVLSDDAGISKSIIDNATLRVLKTIKDKIERDQYGLDEGSYEYYYNKTCSNYQNFFGEAIKKITGDEYSLHGSEVQDGSTGNAMTTSGISKGGNDDLESVLDAIDTLKDELESTLEVIEDRAVEQIKGGDVILTVGYCNTLSRIFKKASEKNQIDPIHIVVCQGPNNNGAKMVRMLKKEKCPCDVSFITDSSMYVALEQGVKNGCTEFFLNIIQNIF